MAERKKMKRVLIKYSCSRSRLIDYWCLSSLSSIVTKYEKEVLTHKQNRPVNPLGFGIGVFKL